MMTMVPQLSLRITDCLYIQTSEVSISHILNIAKAHGAPVIDGRALNSLSSTGILHLTDVGSWLSINNVAIKFWSHTDTPDNLKWTERSKENWIKLTHSLNSIKAEWYTIGNTDLMMARDIRQSNTDSISQYTTPTTVILTMCWYELGIRWLNCTSGEWIRRH
jgi:hypothetical protein